MAFSDRRADTASLQHTTLAQSDIESQCHPLPAARISEPRHRYPRPVATVLHSYRCDVTLCNYGDRDTCMYLSDGGPIVCVCVCVCVRVCVCSISGTWSSRSSGLRRMVERPCLVTVTARVSLRVSLSLSLSRLLAVYTCRATPSPVDSTRNICDMRL